MKTNKRSRTPTKSLIDRRKRNISSVIPSPLSTAMFLDCVTNFSEMESQPSTSKSTLDTTSSCINSPTEPLAVEIRPPSPYTGDFGEYFSQQYSIVKLVLSYLNYYDLNTLREVNTSLKTAADILLKKRNWIQYTSLQYVPRYIKRPEPEHSGHYVDLRIEPKVLFTFECIHGNSSNTTRPKISMRLRDRNDDNFFPKSDILPKSIKTFIPIGGKGIVYTDKNDKNEMVTKQTVLFKRVAFLYLPSSDSYDVSVYTGLITSETFEPEPIQEFFTSDPRPIRGIIFLKTVFPPFGEMIRFIEQMVTNNQSEPFALSGADILSLDYDNPQKKNILGIMKIIVFRGNGIHCMSDIISSTTDDDINEGLKLATMHVNKTIGKLNVHKSFIMMFINTKRNRYPIGDYTNIAKAFPNIPIFGMFTSKEIGLRSFKTEDYRSSPEMRNLDEMYSITTTYILITTD